MSGGKMNMLRKSSVLAMIAALMVTHFAFAADDKNKDPELLMGVAPFMSPDKLFKRLNPLRNFLSRALSREVVLEFSRNPAQLIERTDAGRYDLVFTGPSFALRAFDSGLYLPGAIPGNHTTSVLLVSSSSVIQSIEQLKGKVISTPPQKSLAAKVAPSFFRENGFIKSEIPKMLPYASHNAAFLAAQNGDVDAAFIVAFGYSDVVASGALVREIARTKPFPGISFIVAKRLPEAQREGIISAILDLNNSSQGKKVLKKIAFPPFRRYSYEEFDNFRSYFSKNSDRKNR